MAREVEAFRVAVCSCKGSIPLREERLHKALPGVRLTLHQALCHDEIAQARALLADNSPLLICCTQEAPLFTELAEELQGEAGEDADGVLPRFVNIREAAGWSSEGERASPKMAALIRAAMHLDAPAPVREASSRGRCLVIGPAQPVLEVAGKLAQSLAVSTLITSGLEDALPPRQRAFVLRHGELASLQGRFGDFQVRMRKVAPVAPWGREGLQLLGEQEQPTLEETHDIIIEIGDAPRFGRHGRDGHIFLPARELANGGRLAEALIAAAVARAEGLVGSFETVVHAECERRLCAHARNGIAGCGKCLDACPSNAISSDGDAVRIDPFICDGCGDCAAVCPSGAIRYLTPRRDDLLKRAELLLSTYLEAGGEQPVLLLVEEGSGEDMLAALARFGDGLPAHVLPLAVHSVSMLSHADMAALMVGGAARLAVLAPRAKAAELDSLRGEMALFEAFLQEMGYDTARAPALLVSDDPFELGEWLAGLALALESPRLGAVPHVGGKREIARQALELMHAHAPRQPEVMALPRGAPWGKVEIDAQRCTLCLACVGACPAGALGDNPQQPQLRFVQANCLQCGLCRRTCPEDAISLRPGFDFRPEARDWAVLMEDEPMQCPACGKAFGSKRAVEGIIARLEKLHNPHFASARQRELLRYCEDCRVVALTMSEEDPFAAQPPPKPRVTEDYLEEMTAGEPQEKN